MVVIRDTRVQKRQSKLKYEFRGHAAKLKPIISSLDRLDHDDSAWSDVRTRVKLVEQTLSTLLEKLDAAQTTTHTDELRTSVDLLATHCRDALRAQHDLFAEHRRLCVSALALRECNEAATQAPGGM